MKRSTSILLASTLAIVAAVLGAIASRTLIEHSSGEPPQLVKATPFDPPRKLPDVRLLDGDGRAGAVGRLAGSWHLLFFGFTNCPDVCPNTLTILAAVDRQLADLPAAKRPGVVLVSVDPERDDPARIGAYVRFFDERFTGLTGEPAQISDLTRALGVPVAKVPLPGDTYTIDHGAGIFVIDPELRVRAYFSTPHDPDVIAADYRRIVG
jgi:protein SCO1/2